MKPPISKRYDFVFLFDVTNGNPNGDPDAGNSPRLDPETGHGLVSDVCIKRKIRNYISLTKNPDGNETTNGYDIYVKEKAILNNQHARAYTALKDKGAEIDAKTKKSKPGFEDQAKQWMCQTFFDVRMFGAVMSTGVNAGQVRGPVQIAFSRSLDPIISLEQSITRMAVTTEKESENQEGGNRTMGRKEIIPYGLYRCHGFVNANLAKQTGFNEEDLKLLWQSLINLFEHDRSASRGEMSSQKLFVFEHENELGSHPAHKLFDRVKYQKKDPAKPARSFADYQQVDAGALTDLPTGVQLSTPLGRLLLKDRSAAFFVHVHPQLTFGHSLELRRLKLPKSLIQSRCALVSEMIRRAEKPSPRITNIAKPISRPAVDCSSGNRSTSRSRKCMQERQSR